MKQNWTYKKLGDVCGEAQNIKWIEGEEKTYIDLTSVDRETHTIVEPVIINGNNAPSRAKQIVKTGDVLFGTTRPMMKRVCVIDDSFDEQVCSTGFCLLRPEQEVLPRWVFYNLLSNSFYLYIEPLQNGVAYPAVSNKEVRSYLAPIPPIETQSQIVNELDLLQSIMDKQKAQLKELDNLAQAVFYDMFGDPVENEKGWEVKKLKDVGEGKLSYGSGASAIGYDGEVRYIRITDIEDNGSLKDEKVSPSEFNSKYLLNDGDILFARSGATVGKTYMHKTLYGKSIYAGYLIRLIPNKKLVLPEYVLGYTKTACYKSFVAMAQKAVAQPNINAEQYGNLLIGVPPLSLQQSFATKIESIEKQKAAIGKSIEETQKLFDYTMDKYFG